MCFREDRLIVMGWDVAKVNFSGIDEKKALRMVGESLHMGCIGCVLYLVFLSDDGPWWAKPNKLHLARPVQAVSAPASSSQPDLQKGPKRSRRTGCMPLPKSCRS